LKKEKKISISFFFYNKKDRQIEEERKKRWFPIFFFKTKKDFLATEKKLCQRKKSIHFLHKPKKEGEPLGNKERCRTLSYPLVG
jgi:hypothetical protein